MRWRRVISANVDGTEGSFIGRLHEEATFDPDAFWPLYDAINDMNEALAGTREAELDLVRGILRIQNAFLSCLFHHFDAEDGFLIANLEGIDHQAYVDRLTAVISMFGRARRDDGVFGEGLRPAGGRAG